MAHTMQWDWAFARKSLHMLPVRGAPMYLGLLLLSSHLHVILFFSDESKCLDLPHLLLPCNCGLETLDQVE